MKFYCQYNMHTLQHIKGGGKNALVINVKHDFIT